MLVSGNIRTVLAACLSAALLNACSLDSNEPSTRVDTSNAELAAALFSGAYFGGGSPLAPLGSDQGIAVPMPGSGVPMPPPPRDSVDHITGLTRTHTVAFFDVDGVRQPTFDQLTTERIVTTSSLEGTFQMRDGMHPVTISQSGTTTVSGLAGTESRRTMNGASQSKVNTTMNTMRGAVAIEVTSADRILSLVLPVPATRTTARLIPISGSVVHERTVTHTPPGGSAIQAVMRWTTTYDGTEIARMRIEHGGTVRNCTINLVTYAFTCG